MENTIKLSLEANDFQERNKNNKRLLKAIEVLNRTVENESRYVIGAIGLKEAREKIKELIGKLEY